MASKRKGKHLQHRGCWNYIRYTMGKLGCEHMWPLATLSEYERKCQNMVFFTLVNVLHYTRASDQQISCSTLYLTVKVKSKYININKHQQITST